MQRKLEIIGFNIESCLTAQKAGAQRIELCASPGEGGTTPSRGLIEIARKMLHIDLYVMIRPRGGDFLYSDAEFDTMMADVEVCRELHCDGIVLGILDENGRVDRARCKYLIERAYPMGVTFHRAFDRANDPFRALDDVMGLGCERILTSGLKPRAIEATDLLRQLVEKAGNDMIIMPGSGVKASILPELIEKTGAKEYHSSASLHQPSAMKNPVSNWEEDMGYIGVNANEVRQMATILQTV